MAARDGTEGLIWGVLHCNQMRLLRGEEEEEEEEYYVLSHSPLPHCCVFFFFVVVVRADFDVISLYFETSSAVCFKISFFL